MSKDILDSARRFRAAAGAWLDREAGKCLEFKALRGQYTRAEWRAKFWRDLAADHRTCWAECRAMPEALELEFRALRAQVRTYRQLARNDSAMVAEIRELDEIERRVLAEHEENEQ